MGIEKTETENGHVDTEPSEGKNEAYLMANVKNPAFRRQIILWMCLPIGTISIGIVDSLGGTTLLDLQIITFTDKEMSSFFITAVNCGYLLGSILGGLVHGKINSYLLMAISSLFAGGVCIASPYCTTFLLMFLIRSAAGLFLGVVLCIVNAEHMHIWGSKGESLLQLIGCTYAVGGVIGPLMTSPFLAEKETENKTLSHQNVTLDSFNNLTEAKNSTLPRTTEVHYAFLIAGSILIVTAIPYLIVLIVTSNTHTSQGEDTQGHDAMDRKLPLRLKICMIAIVFLFFFTYCCVEVTFSAFLMTFVVNQYEEVTTHDGAYFNTFFWSAFAGTRFLSIFTSKYITAVRLLYMHFTLLTFALSGFLVGALYSRINILRVFTCFAGVACSAIFSAGISWTEAELMTVSGPISAVILIGSSAGVMTIPSVVGSLMEYHSNLWFCYCLMGSIAMALSFFIFTLSFNRCYVDRKYGKLSEVRKQKAETSSQVTGVELAL